MRNLGPKQCFEFHLALLSQPLVAHTGAASLNDLLAGGHYRASKVVSLTLRRVRDVCKAFGDLHVKGIPGI